MPFFPDGPSGGANDYKIVGTNVIGGHDSQIVNVGDNNMTLGNNAGQEWINANGVVAIGNNAARYSYGSGNSLIAGYRCFENGFDAYESTVLGHAFWHDNTLNIDNGPNILRSIVNIPSSDGGWSGPVGPPPLEYERGLIQNSVWLGVDTDYGGLSFENTANLYGSILIGTWRGDPGSNMVSPVNMSRSVVIGAAGYPYPNPPDINTPDSVREVYILGDTLFIYPNGGEASGHCVHGRGTFTDSNDVTAMGTLLEAVNAERAVAIGYNAHVNGSDTIAIGSNTSANAGEIVIGDPSLTWDSVVVGGVDLLDLVAGAPSYHFNTAMVRAVSGSGTFSAFGVTNTVIGTASTLLFSNSSVVAANPNVYLSSTAAAGASCGVSSANAACITPGSFGNGGFEFAAEFAINDATGGVGNNGRFFVGLSGDGTAPNSNPSSWTTALAGIGSDAGDAEASIFYNVFFGTAVKIPLGVDFPIAAFGVPALWSVSLAWKPGDTVIKCVIKRKTNTATFTHNEDIPLIDSGFALFAHVWRNNAAVAAAVRLAVSGYSVKNYVGWDSPA